MYLYILTNKIIGVLQGPILEPLLLNTKTYKTDIINVIYLFAVKRIDKFQSIYRYNRFPQHSKRYRQHISVSHHCSNNSDQSLAYQVSCSGTEAPINAAN